MKKLELYMCEVCGTQYSDKSECAKCEHSHAKRLKISDARYLPYSQQKTGMTVTITVEDEDCGKKYIYKR